MAAITIWGDFGNQENKVCHTSTFSPSISHKVILGFLFVCFLMLSFKLNFYSTLSPSSKGSLVPLHFLPLECYCLHISISLDNLDFSLWFIQPGISHDALCIELPKRQYTALMYSFLNFKPVHCSMSGSNCCFLTCILVSQETGKVVWYSHPF